MKADNNLRRRWRFRYTEAKNESEFVNGTRNTQERKRGKKNTKRGKVMQNEMKILENGGGESNLR